MTVLAHGIGGRADLPIPSWLAMYAGAVAVLVSFLVLTALWPRPRLRGAAAGLPVPRRLQRIVDGPVLRWSLQVLGLVLLAVFLVVAWWGPDDGGRANPAPTWFYVWFWVGLVPVSLLLGPVWRRINPLRTLAGLLGTIVRSPVVRLPRDVGYWPGGIALLAFLWLELVYDEAASPRVVAVFVTVYVVVQVGAGVLFGPSWFARGDGFEVYAWMVSRASPVGRRADGRLVVRNPLDGLAAMPTVPDLTPVVVIVLGSTAFDGLSRTSLWTGLTSGTGRGAYLALGTAGLVATLAAVVVTYGLAVRLTRPSLAESVRLGGAELAHSIIPIAIGYTVAHYFSFALFQGQQGYLLANDPFAAGWNLLGLAGASVDYRVLPMVAIAIVQTGAIILGHVAGVIAAHDRSLSVLAPGAERRGQYPMLVVMILYTVSGVALIAGA